MKKRIRANSFLLFADLLAELHTAYRDRRTVVRFVYEGHDGFPTYEFEVRVTRVGNLKLPALARKLGKKEFIERLAHANRDLLARKGLA